MYLEGAESIVAYHRRGIYRLLEHASLRKGQHMGIRISVNQLDCHDSGAAALKVACCRFAQSGNLSHSSYMYGSG